VNANPIPCSSFREVTLQGPAAAGQ
jgi:hypothetical protein